MATAIGLSMQLSASTSGLTAGLTEAERLINQLGKGAESAARYFDSFRDATTGELPSAMQGLADSAGELTAAFRAGSVDSEAFAAGIRAITEEATQITKAFQEGAAVTAQFRTEEEKRAETLDRLGQLLSQGAINQETYDRAIAQASGANQAAADAERERAAAIQSAAQITSQNLSPVERYDAKIQELESHLNAGRISEETFASAVESASRELERAEAAAGAAGRGAEQAGLQFNELSGLFGLLPGPIGQIASKISAFASASQGLQKLFAGGGGLSGALASLGGSIVALINPFTLAIAGIAAFGTAVSAIKDGLISLEDRVEKLGNQAEKLGASFQFIQVLETAADRSGQSISGLSASFNRFLKAVDDAKSGSDKATEAFARIGISAEDLENKKPEEIYRTMAVKIAEIEDPATRAGVAMDLLGRSGLDLIPTFKQIANSERDLARYFATLSDLDKLRLDNLGNSLDAFATASRGLGQSLLLPFTGLAEGITQGFAEFTGGLTAILQPIGQVLEPFLTQIGRTFEILLTGLGAIGRTIGAVLAPIGNVFSEISNALAPLYDRFVDLFGAINGAAESVAAFAVEFTFIGQISKNIESITEAIAPFVNDFVDKISYIIEVIQRLGTIIGAAFKQAYDAIAGYVGQIVGAVSEATEIFIEFTGIGSIVSDALSVVGSAFSTLWDTITGIISGIGGFIEKIVSFAERWLGITREIKQPIEAEITIDAEGPLLAATQFYDEISKAVESTKDLGEEGFAAALKYQNALETLAQLAAEGEYSEEELKRAVEQTTEEFERSIAPLQAAQKAREDAAKAAERAAEQQIAADRRVADQAIETQRIQDEFGGSKERFEATEKLLAIEREIARVTEAIAAARAAGDKEALDAAVARLAAIDQAREAIAETAEFGFNQQNIDKSIADVRKQVDESMEDFPVGIAPDALEEFKDRIKDLEQQLQLKLIDPEQFKEAADEARKLFEESKKQAEKIRDLQVKYAEEAAKIQEERIEGLSKVSTESLKVDDVRTSAGASEFLRLATGRDDPAIEEYRKQFKKLEEIRKEISKQRQALVEI